MSIETNSTLSALKQALEALDDIKADCAGCEFEWSNDYPLQAKTAEALRQAIAEAEKQEPVAEKVYDPEDDTAYIQYFIPHELIPVGTKFYTHSPVPQGHKPKAEQCTRSHPHEEMDAMCELRTEIARLTNQLTQPKEEQFDHQKAAQNGLREAMNRSQEIAKAAQPKAAVPTEHKQEPCAMRYDFDGYGYKYIDSGSGSDWKTRIKDAEPVFASPYVATPRQPKAELLIEIDGEVMTIPQAAMLELYKFQEATGCDTADELAQPKAEQELVAMQMDVIVVNLVREGINKHRARELAEHFIKTTSPYVAEPRQPQKPLTDEWILHLGDIHVGEVNSIYPMSSSDWINFARAIEAAHGIKE